LTDDLPCPGLRRGTAGRPDQGVPQVRQPAERLPVFVRGGVIALTGQGVAEAAAVGGVVRLQADRLPEGGDRPVEVVPLVAEDLAEGAVGLGEVRLEAEGLAEGGLRLLVLALAGQRLAAVVAGDGVVLARPALFFVVELLAPLGRLLRPVPGLVQP